MSTNKVMFLLMPFVRKDDLRGFVVPDEIEEHTKKYLVQQQLDEKELDALLVLLRDENPVAPLVAVFPPEMDFVRRVLKSHFNYVLVGTAFMDSNLIENHLELDWNQWLYVAYDVQTPIRLPFIHVNKESCDRGSLLFFN